MLAESHRGHLNFWLSEVVGLAAVGALVVAVLVVEEEGEGEGEGSKAPDTGRSLSLFKSPVAPPPNSSWIIFSFLDLKMNLKKETRK